MVDDDQLARDRGVLNDRGSERVESKATRPRATLAPKYRVLDDQQEWALWTVARCFKSETSLWRYVSRDFCWLLTLVLELVSEICSRGMTCYYTSRSRTLVKGAHDLLRFRPPRWGKKYFLPFFYKWIISTITSSRSTRRVRDSRRAGVMISMGSIGNLLHGV